MYSPGSVKVALVIPLPLNGAEPANFSTAGLSAPNVTSAGPRNMTHFNVTGEPKSFGRTPDELVNFASSDTQTVSGRGLPTFAARATDNPCGPCTDWPFSSKLSTGGVFPTAASMSGEIS